MACSAVQGGSAFQRRSPRSSVFSRQASLRLTATITTSWSLPRAVRFRHSGPPCKGPAADAAAAQVPSGAVVVGGQSQQGGRLAAAERAELGHVGWEGVERRGGAPGGLRIEFRAKL